MRKSNRFLILTVLAALWVLPVQATLVADNGPSVYSGTNDTDGDAIVQGNLFKANTVALVTSDVKATNRSDESVYNPVVTFSDYLFPRTVVFRHVWENG